MKRSSRCGVTSPEGFRWLADLCVVRNPDRRQTQFSHRLMIPQDRDPPIADRARAALVRLSPDWSDMGEGIKVEPVWKGPRKCLRPLDRKPHSLGFNKAH